MAVSFSVRGLVVRKSHDLIPCKVHLSTDSKPKPISVGFEQFYERGISLGTMTYLLTRARRLMFE